MIEPSLYFFVKPSLRPQRQGELRQSERVRADVGVEFRGRPRRCATTIDVSRDGLLVAAPHIAPLHYIVLLDLYLADGPLSTAAVVVRHATVDGEEALGLKLYGLGREMRARWARAVAAHSQAKRDGLIEVPLLFDIDVVDVQAHARAEADEHVHAGDVAHDGAHEDTHDDTNDDADGNDRDDANGEADADAIEVYANDEAVAPEAEARADADDGGEDEAVDGDEDFIELND